MKLINYCGFHKIVSFKCTRYYQILYFGILAVKSENDNDNPKVRRSCRFCVDFRKFDQVKS